MITWTDVFFSLFVPLTCLQVRAHTWHTTFVSEIYWVIFNLYCRMSRISYFSWSYGHIYIHTHTHSESGTHAVFFPVAHMRKYCSVITPTTCYCSLPVRLPIFPDLLFPLLSKEAAVRPPVGNRKWIGRGTPAALRKWWQLVPWTPRVVSLEAAVVPFYPWAEFGIWAGWSKGGWRAAWVERFWCSA